MTTMGRQREKTAIYIYFGNKYMRWVRCEKKEKTRKMSTNGGYIAWANDIPFNQTRMGQQQQQCQSYWSMTYQ
jgi:hypothetical protein